MLPDSFAASIETLRRAIRLHCYRMLGSAHDSDDLVQETMLRAWKAKESLADPALVKPWLYRIATNACLDELKTRPRRVLAFDAYPADDNAGPPFARVEEPIWLEPMPNAWLDDAVADPHAAYTLKESVALAFCAALQFLTPLQRATLLLRDVVGLSADETADALDIGVPAANSALFRARTAVETQLGARVGEGTRTGVVDEALLAQYVRAFEDANLDELVSLFHDDMRTTMPPAPLWVDGRASNERFFRRMFGGLAPREVLYRSIGANGQPARAFYRLKDDGKHLLSAIQLFGTRDGKIVSVDHFMQPEVLGLFGVPRVLD